MLLKFKNPTNARFTFTRSLIAVVEGVEVPPSPASQAVSMELANLSAPPPGPAGGTNGTSPAPTVSGLIDWLGDVRRTMDAAATSGTPALDASPAWLRQFLLELAQETPDPNGDIQLVLTPPVQPAVTLTA